MKTVRTLVAAACLAMGSLGGAMAEDSAEVKALKEQKAKIELERDIAQAAADRAKAEVQKLEEQRKLADAEAAKVKTKAELERDVAKAAAEKAKSELEQIKTASEQLQEQKKQAEIESGSDAASIKARADAETAIANQRKAAAEAQAAAIGAETAATKAKFGTVSGSALTGAVDVGSGAGNGEATLLAAQAINVAADRIVFAIQAKAKAKAEEAKQAKEEKAKEEKAGGAQAEGEPPEDAAQVADAKAVSVNGYVLLAGTTPPSFARLQAFRVQVAAIDGAFKGADQAKQQADMAAEQTGTPKAAGATESTEAVGTLITGAGAILDSLSKLGSYFQSDYKAGAATVTGVDDQLLATAVAGKLEGAFYPDRWSTPFGLAPITELLKAVSPQRETSVNSLQAAILAQQQLEASAAKEAKEERKATLQDVAKQYGRAAEMYRRGQKLYDDLISSLAALDKDGIPAAGAVANEHALAEKFKAGAGVVYLHVHAATGGYYTKKNLWTFFGGMPFFVSGGAVASYTVVDGRNGTVLCAGQVPIHSGYYKVSKVASRFQ